MAMKKFTRISIDDHHGQIYFTVQHRQWDGRIMAEDYRTDEHGAGLWKWAELRYNEAPTWHQLSGTYQFSMPKTHSGQYKKIYRLFFDDDGNYYYDTKVPKFNLWDSIREGGKL